MAQWALNNLYVQYTSIFKICSIFWNEYHLFLPFGSVAIGFWLMASPNMWNHASQTRGPRVPINAGICTPTLTRRIYHPVIFGFAYTSTMVFSIWVSYFWSNICNILKMDKSCISLRSLEQHPSRAPRLFSVSTEPWAKILCLDPGPNTTVTKWPPTQGKLAVNNTSHISRESKEPHLPSGYVKIAIENGPVEIVDLPVDSMMIFHSYVSHYQRVLMGTSEYCGVHFT